MSLSQRKVSGLFKATCRVLDRLSWHILYLSLAPCILHSDWSQQCHQWHYWTLSCQLLSFSTRTPIGVGREDSSDGKASISFSCQEMILHTCHCCLWILYYTSTHGINVLHPPALTPLLPQGHLAQTWILLKLVLKDLWIFLNCKGSSRRSWWVSFKFVEDRTLVGYCCKINGRRGTLNTLCWLQASNLFSHFTQYAEWNNQYHHPLLL